MANFSSVDDGNFPSLKDSMILYNRSRGRGHNDNVVSGHDQYTLVLNLHYTNVAIQDEADSYVVLSQSAMTGDQDHEITVKSTITTRKFKAVGLKKLQKVNIDSNLTLSTIAIVDNGGICFDSALPERIDAEDWDEILSTAITTTRDRDVELRGEYEIVDRSEVAGAVRKDDDDSDALVVVLRPFHA